MNCLNFITEFSGPKEVINPSLMALIWKFQMTVRKSHIRGIMLIRCAHAPQSLHICINRLQHVFNFAVVLHFKESQIIL